MEKKTSRTSYNKKLLEAIVSGKVGNAKQTTRKAAETNYGASESQIQQDCMKWFWLQYPAMAQSGLLFHIPNEGIRLGRMGARVKREGVVRGVADLFLCVARGGYHGLFIEMKKPGRYQRPEQKTWQRHVEQQGYLYLVCKSLEEFMKIIKDYLDGRYDRNNKQPKEK